MIADRMWPARAPGSGSGWPDIQWLTMKASEAIVRGTVLIYDTGEVKVAGADPTGIVGIALAPADSAPGYNVQNNPQVHTGRQNKIPVARANRQTVFLAYMTNGSSTRVTPAASDVGVSYGITAYSGIWTVDKNKTGASERVTVIGIDTTTSQSVVFFKFKESAIYA